MAKRESAVPSEHWTARLKQFQEYTVAHPHLVEAKDRLVAAIRESAPNSLILVVGPTGVGKSTLRGRIEQLLTTESLSELESDTERMPVVSVEAVAPPFGSFSWRDHFKRMLSTMDEPLIERKRMLLPCGSESDLVFTPGPKAPGGEYYQAVEQALRYRRPCAVLIDEAQHLAKMNSGRRLLDQLDVIKSLANRTGTVHALFGTYDLLAFRNLSGQLSRRSVDVHFRRYRADNAEDRKAEYYLGFHRLLGEHVEQIVLYVGPEPLRMQPVFETPAIRYEFQLLDIRDVDGEPLLASDDWGDNLLALLTQVDQERVLQRVEQQIRKLKGEEQETAARLFVIVSGIIGLEEAVVRRLNMIDIMENKVLGPAILQGEAAVVIRLLEKRFGAVPEWVRERLGAAEEPELMAWAERVLSAQSLNDVFKD